MASQGPAELPGASGCLASPGEGKKRPGAGGSWSQNPPDTAGQTHGDSEDRPHWVRRGRRHRGRQMGQGPPTFSLTSPESSPLAPGHEPLPPVWGGLRVCVQPPQLWLLLGGDRPRVLGGRHENQAPLEGVKDGVGEGPSAQRQLRPHSGHRSVGGLVLKGQLLPPSPTPAARAADTSHTCFSDSSFIGAEHSPPGEARHSPSETRQLS